MKRATVLAGDLRSVPNHCKPGLAIALLFAVLLNLIAAAPAHVSATAPAATGGPIQLLKDINQIAVGVAFPTNLVAVAIRSFSSRRSSRMAASYGAATAQPRPLGWSKISTPASSTETLVD